MNLTDSFSDKLKEGKVIEDAVYATLDQILPEHYSVKMTDQSPGAKERKLYNLVDVVVFYKKCPIVGIECKYSETPFRYCQKINGWSPDLNTPINDTSLRKYRLSNFPYYVLNVNKFAHKILVADSHTLFNSRFSRPQAKPDSLTTVIWNICGETWDIYEDDVKLSDILKDILRKVGVVC